MHLAKCIFIICAENRIDVVQAGPPLGVELPKAHLVLSWDFNLRTILGGNLDYKKSKFLYKKGEYKKLSEFLNTQDWENMFRDKDVQYIGIYRMYYV